MKNVDIYNAAIAIAQANVGNSNQVAFEAALGAKGVQLGLPLNEYNQFCTDARGIRSKFANYQTQDDNAAKAAAARAANANAPKAAISPATGLPYTAQTGQPATPVAIAAEPAKGGSTTGQGTPSPEAPANVVQLKPAAPTESNPS